MRIRNCKDYIIKNYTPTKDNEGNVIKKYSTGYIVSAYIYPLTGAMYLQQYGNELQYQYKMLTDENYEPRLVNGKLTYIGNGGYSLSEGDGVCVFSSEVDFTIKSIIKQGHLIIGLEMIH